MAYTKIKIKSSIERNVRTMWFDCQVSDVGSQTSRQYLVQWTDLKTPVNQVTCGTEYMAAVLGRAAARSALVTLCTLMDLEREKHELFHLIYGISSKPFAILTMIVSYSI